MNLSQDFNSSILIQNFNELNITKNFIETKNSYAIVIIFFIIGIFGNFLALVILAKKKNSRNTKYTLMLRCLTSNNLIGLMGMLIQLLCKMYLSSKFNKTYIHINCIGLVLWRFFGLTSGCIAATMSLERYLALARPFTYHKHITYKIVKRSIQFLVMISTIITFLPLIGFGVYYDRDNQKCLRYRDATTYLDISYAFVFMIFGTLLCVIIVVCNFFVTQVLCFIGQRKTTKRIIYQYSSTNSRQNDSENSFSRGSLKQQISTTSDEIRFAKLMTFLSISFVICWMPQMISIPLALIPPSLPKSHWFFRIADILMALHFTSDPYIYVISRSKYSFISDCSKFWMKRTTIRRGSSNQNHFCLHDAEQTMEFGLNG